MSEIMFEPAVGANYMTTGFEGLRIMLLGESHHGDLAESRPEITHEVVRWLGQTERFSFFTVVAKALLGIPAGDSISDERRAKFWEDVCFYQYVQELISGPRKSPRAQQFADAAPVLEQVMRALQPDVIVVLGKRMAWSIPKVLGHAEIVMTTHPQGGFDIAHWSREIATAIRAAKAKKAERSEPIKETTECIKWAANFSEATAPSKEKLEGLRTIAEGIEQDGKDEEDGTPDFG